MRATASLCSAAPAARRSSPSSRRPRPSTSADRRRARLPTARRSRDEEVRASSARGPCHEGAMNREALARIIDHSVLRPEATDADIRAGAEVVRACRIGFYCVQPCWVRVAAAALVGTDARVVAVAGFPHGCERAEVKALTAELAVADGAAEIDMVMNFGALRS